MPYSRTIGADVGGALQIVVRAGRDLAEHHVFGGAAAQQHVDLAEQLRLRHEVAIVGGSCW